MKLWNIEYYFGDVLHAQQEMSTNKKVQEARNKSRAQNQASTK